MSDACGCSDHGETSPNDDDDVRPPWWRDTDFVPSAISGIALATGLILEWTSNPTAATIAFWISLIAGATTFVPGAIRRLARSKLGIGLLMTIAATGAVLLGHVGEAAALAFLFSLAETLEDRAMDRAKEGLRALLSLIPETVRLSRAGTHVNVPAAEIREGDTLVVGPGERIATDGVVVQGSSSIDASAVTGESIPVQVVVGTAVLAGSVNGSGSLLVEATADGRDNSLTQIVALVEQAHATKGERARLADRIAGPLVPGVLVISAAVALFGIVTGDPWTWIERALVVLVAASPCALAIAVPVTVISAIGAASKFGVVIKSGAAFEEFGSITTVVFDKTGTLTRNEPAVVQVITADGVAEGELLSLAAAIESTSTHPLAAAIVAGAAGGYGTTGRGEASGTDAAVGLNAGGMAGAPSETSARSEGAATMIFTAVDVIETPGLGIAGTVGGHTVRVGSSRWLHPGVLHADLDVMTEEGITVAVVEVDGAVVGLIGVRDELRPEAAETVRLLDEQGVSTVMLTGDNYWTARALASQAGIAEVHAQQLPAQKAAVIGELVRVAPTAMVGDGINDSPALATATVGIAMGAKGSAAAVESADIAFTGHDLRLIPAALAHARRGRRIMTANVLLALAIIVGLFPLALFGVLGLAGVVLVHEVAEVVVILNGMRAARPASTPAFT